MNDPVNHPQHYTENNIQEEGVECSYENKNST
jgi:hypothetical protein